MHVVRIHYVARKSSQTPRRTRVNQSLEIQVLANIEKIRSMGSLSDEDDTSFDEDEEPDSDEVSDR